MIKLSNYEYEEDDKIHINYSKLKNCTRVGVLGVIKELLNGGGFAGNKYTMFGHMRHKMFQEETTRTGKLPQCFDEVVEIEKASLSEQELVMKYTDKTTIHSRIDVYLPDSKTVVDYKTTTNPKYRPDKIQLLLYAFNLMSNNIEVKNMMYLIEIWDDKRTMIVGYKKYFYAVTTKELMKINVWLNDRVERLEVAYELAITGSSEKLLTTLV